MELIKVEQGESLALPCAILGAGHGFTHTSAPSGGVMILLAPGEGEGGGMFVPAQRLADTGFVPVEPLRARLFVAFAKDELVELARRVGVETRGTKAQLVERLLAGL